MEYDAPLPLLSQVTSYESRGFIQISPQPRLGASPSPPLPPLLLGFWAEVHYNPIMPLETPRG